MGDLKKNFILTTLIYQPVENGMKQWYDDWICSIAIILFNDMF